MGLTCFTPLMHVASQAVSNEGPMWRTMLHDISILQYYCNLMNQIEYLLYKWERWLLTQVMKKMFLKMRQIDAQGGREPSELAAKMLRRGNLVSDDSISDEDVAEIHNDQQANFPSNMLSLQEDAANQIELPLPARLDLLKGRICNQNSSSSFEKPLEDDEVEMPDFKDGDLHDVLGEVVADSSDEENVSEDEVCTVLSTRHLYKNGHPFIRNDQVKDTNSKSEALLRFKESASCSASRATRPKANTSDKGRDT